MSTESKEIAPDAQIAPESRQETPVEAEPKPKSKEYNFRKMETKLQEMEARLAASEAEKASLKQQAPSSNPGDEDLQTVGQTRRMIEQEARRIAQEAIQKRDLETLADRLSAKFSDFEQVVSEDAVDQLKEEHPELFNSLKSNPDPYQKGIAAYKLIKNMVGKDPKKEANTKANAQRLEENKQKPNVGAGNNSVLSQATGWVKPSKEQKAAMYAEMKTLASKRN